MRDWQLRPELSSRLRSYARELHLTGTDLLELMVTASLPNPHDESGRTAQKQAAWILERLQKGANSPPGSRNHIRSLYDIWVPEGVDAAVLRLPGHTVVQQEGGPEREYGVDLAAGPSDTFIACMAERLVLEAPYPGFLVATRLGLIMAVFSEIVWDIGEDGRAVPVSGWHIDPALERAHPVGRALGRSRKLRGHEYAMTGTSDAFFPGTLMTFPRGQRLAYRVGARAAAKRKATARFRERDNAV